MAKLYVLKFYLVPLILRVGLFLLVCSLFFKIFSLDVLIRVYLVETTKTIKENKSYRSLRTIDILTSMSSSIHNPRWCNITNLFKFRRIRTPTTTTQSSPFPPSQMMSPSPTVRFHGKVVPTVVHGAGEGDAYRVVQVGGIVQPGVGWIAKLGVGDVPSFPVWTCLIAEGWGCVGFANVNTAMNVHHSRYLDEFERLEGRTSNNIIYKGSGKSFKS